MPDPFDPDTTHHPVMLTTDPHCGNDHPAFEAISRRFLEHPDQFEDAFARAWSADAHRHGPGSSEAPSARPGRTADLAGPGAGGRPRPGRRRRRRRPQTREILDPG
ncbi:hypothetical protein HBB16_00710 [Pseudonocardia sp. MCCB 268]|nr:hypothetical protein [Pseudonocardia cytotoxica]